MARASCILAALVLACGGDGGSGDDQGNNGSGGAAGGGSATCAEGEFAIAGDLDGEAVSYRGSVDNYAWAQTDDTRILEVTFRGGGRVHTEWAERVSDGQTTDVTGSLTLPPDGSHGSETLLGTGSMTRVDTHVSFELGQLAIEVTCDSAPCPAEAVEGALQGCVHWRPIDI